MKQNDPQIVESLSSRPMVLFTNSIKSEHTKKQYLFYLRKFMIWSDIDNAAELVKKPEPELQTLIEDYLFCLKDKLSPNSLNPLFAALELFFSINDKILNFKKIRKMFTARVKKSGRDFWTTEQIVEMLKVSHNRRTRALVHFLSSTGCRIGAVPKLKLRYIKNCKQNCISKSILNNLQGDDYLLPINFTYPKLVHDYWDGNIILPVYHDQYTDFSTDFRTTYNNDTLPYQPTGTTKKQLIDENFQETLKRMGASDLIQNRVADLNRTIFHLEQEKELAKLLHDDNKVRNLTSTIDVLGQQVSVYQQESKKLWDELGLLQAYNIDLYKMDTQNANKK
jgi:hypothetical protein